MAIRNSKTVDPLPANPVRGAIAGFLLPFQALGLLRRERALWLPAAAPVAIALVSLLVCFGLILQHASEVHGWIVGGLPVLNVGAWYSWLWIGPAKLALTLLGWLLLALAAGIALAASLVVANVVASPALDVLSRRVEQVVIGRVVEEGSGGILGLPREAGRALLNELQRALSFAGVWLAIFAIGIVVPGGQAIAPPALLLLTLLYLPLDYASYVLDRRQIPFRARRAWIRSHFPTVMGFGSAAFLTMLIPGLNALALSALVVAGTLLVVRDPPPRAQQSSPR